MSELIIFAHLQRTGGNSLRELLAANFGGSATIRGTADSVGGYIQRAAAGKIRAVEGLLKYGAHEYLSPRGPYRYFSFLRRPESRWTSYYNFCRVHPSAGLHELAKANTLEAFLAHPKRPLNVAAQVICGYGVEPDIDTLEANLGRFGFIGLQERFVESSFLLCRIFGMPFPFVGYVGRLGASDRSAPSGALSRTDALDDHLQRRAEETMERCLAALGAEDKRVLGLLMETTAAAGEEPALTALLTEVRRAAVPAKRSVALLQKALKDRKDVPGPWRKAVLQVLDHFARAEPLPSLWTDQLKASRPAPGRTDAGPTGTGGVASAGPSAAASGAPGTVRLDGAPTGAGFTLSIENLPQLPQRALFLEHHARGKGRGSEVIAATTRQILVSRDLGDTWTTVNVRRGSGRPVRCFTTREGAHLVRTNTGELDVYDAKWRFVATAQGCTTEHHWHGAWSIDQSADGTICWAEYMDRAETASVFRSTDGGLHWQRVMEASGVAGAPGSIRHFHMVLADPHERGRWYLSSGDVGPECRFWVSSDDGASWQDIGAPNILNPGEFAIGARLHNIFRTTAAIVDEQALYWSTDDLMDGSGPLYVRMDKAAPYAIRVLGRVGSQHTRALIRHADGRFVALSQGNRGSDHVAAHLLTAGGELTELLRVPKPVDVHTSFCRSISSTFTDQGVFFTAGGGKVLDTETRLWRWRLAAAR